VSEQTQQQAPREPILTAPWPALLLVGALVACFLVQSAVGVDQTASRYGFSAEGLAQGHWQTLVTSLFLHGGWAHVLGNSAFALAFATPIARRMGIDARGGFAFFAFFVVCGVLSNLGYALILPREAAPLVGASGALAGLMAASSRMMTPGPGLAPLLSRPVISMAAAWILVNLIVAAVGWAPGAGDAQVAWQAHLTGYVAGLLLFAPALALLRRP
jgi:membrane associated rhomboid family serine protease